MNKVLSMLMLLMLPVFIFSTGIVVNEYSSDNSTIQGGVGDTIKNFPAAEPYHSISGSFFNSRIAESPDPLANYRWPNPKASDGLEIYGIKPVSVKTADPESFRGISSLTSNKPDVTVKGKGTIMMDFGQVNAGWLEFDSPDLTDSIQMSISEYNEPAILNTGAQNRIKTKVPVQHGNTYRLELNRDLYEGVRYGWIHVDRFSKPWHITGIRLVCQIKPANYNGSFSCSDSMLTRIWYNGAYVVKLNLLKDYFGAILMERSDRHSWTGDAHPAQAASMVAFGNYDFVRKNIEYTSTQNNSIASYSLIWVLSLVDYYNYTGDTATLDKLTDNACRKLDAAYEHYGKNPRLRFTGWDERLGAGFENSECAESQNTYKMLSIRAWGEFSKVMETCGRKDLAVKYANYADSKTAELKQDKNWYKTYGLHAATEAINSGITNQKEKEALFEKEFTDRVNRLSYSPFNEYFVIQALARMRKYDEAVSSIRDCWGGQIKYGGTTFFEVYRPSWNDVLSTNDAPPNNQCGYTSMAHPWSAGVTKWLSEEILGIKPTSPGFKTLDITPHLGRTITSVSGRVPTLLGEIGADYNLQTGLIRISVPAGTIARIGIPKVEKSIESITINGDKAWNGKFIKARGIGSASEDDEFIYLVNTKHGLYRISVAYKGVTPKYAESEYIYPATFFREDSLTQGNWGGVYGSKGYILCNYKGPGKDLSKLPSFVTSVQYSSDDGKAKTSSGMSENRLWASGVSDPRALAVSAENEFPRNIGCIYTGDPSPTRQSMTVDFKSDGINPCQMALYFVDWDHKGRRTAVEVFDLESKKMIAPVKIVRNYGKGKYLIYQYNKSVRFRINHVRGENAVLSGIFFD